MSDLRELYQEVILDHSRSPRNYQAIPGATHTAEGSNPLCGDRITLYLRVDGDRITDVAFEGQGCAISKASASMMTVALKGKSREDAAILFERFHEMVTGRQGDPAKEEILGKLAVFSGVSGFPARVKCASLAWHTMRAALDRADRVTME